MKTQSHFLRTVVTAVLFFASILVLPAHAAPKNIEQFAPDTWAHLVADLPRPAVVVFSTTYCTICPETFAKLADLIAERRLKAPLVAVVMDGDGRASLLRDPHYARTDRLFVFRGQEAALRYTVSPRWRGATPFVALLGKEGAPVFVTGTPTTKNLDAWAPGK